MVGNMRERKKGRKRPLLGGSPSDGCQNRSEPFWNSLRKLPRGARWKGWACYCCGKEGTSSGIALRRLGRPGSVSGLQGTTLEERLPPEAQVSAAGLSRSSGPKVPGGPHTSSCPNYAWGAPEGVNNCGGPVGRFPFRHWGNLLCAYWAPSHVLPDPHL